MDKCVVAIAVVLVLALVYWHYYSAPAVQSFCVASGVPASVAAVGTASAAVAAAQAASAGATGAASLPAGVSTDETVSNGSSDNSAVAHAATQPSTAAISVNAVSPSTPATIVATSAPTVAVAAAITPVATAVPITSTSAMESMAPRPVVVQTRAGAAPAVIVPVGTSSVNGVTTYNYVGCFDDKATHLFPHSAPGFLTVDQCRAAAKAAGAQNYALQWAAGAPPGTGACFYGSGIDYKTYGTSAQCNKDQYGRGVGGPGINSVYRV